MEKIVFLTGAFVIGALVTLHVGMQALTASGMRNLPAASVVFWGIGLATSVIIAVCTGSLGAARRAADIPAVLLLAGGLGAVLMIGSAFLMMRLSASAFFCWVVAAQVLTSMVLAHFGSMGSPVSRVSLLKVAGAVMVIAGAWLVVWEGGESRDQPGMETSPRPLESSARQGRPD